jgi:outer membrane protein OmpA-like peptidoglycan-associated protein
LKHKHRSIGEESPKVPGYIVTFSDMTTLLLTFFVMLLSLASVQDDELFGKGRNSFTWSIKNLGLGMFWGRKPKPDLGSVKIKHFISSPDRLFEGRSLNTKEEKIRRVFNDLRQSMKTMPLEAAAKKTNFSVTNIRFAWGDAHLNESAKQFLGNFCSYLQQDSGSGPIKLYVLGLASDPGTERERWILSANRAKAVADYMRGILSSAPDYQTQGRAYEDWSRWSFYWWGAGPGGDWVGQDSPISKQSQILIAVLRRDD